MIVDALRTPIGRFGGALARVRPDDLAALAVAAAVERSGVEPSAIDDVVLMGITRARGKLNAIIVGPQGFPKTINGSRKKRIAAGAGLQIQDVNRLLKQFTQMEKMMRKMSRGGMKKMMRGMPRGGMPPGMR